MLVIFAICGTKASGRPAKDSDHDTPRDEINVSDVLPAERSSQSSWAASNQVYVTSILFHLCPELGKTVHSVKMSKSLRPAHDFPTGRLDSKFRAFSHPLTSRRWHVVIKSSWMIMMTITAQ
jgi:hypothetical protein